MKASLTTPTLSSSALLLRFEALVAHDRATTVQLLRLLDEIDQRQVWAEEGYSSLFAFCVERFHMSEALAYKRIRVARLSRQCPAVLDMLERGEVNLSTVCVLAAHLTRENHLDLLARARHRTKREVEVLAAELCPRPDAGPRIVPLPVQLSPGLMIDHISLR